MLLSLIRLLVLCLFLAGGVFADTVRDSDSVAPGYGALGYSLPEAGSYHLPPLGDASNGEVLSAGGQPTQLYELFGDQYVLLAFIYSTCRDVNGCPLTSHVFYKIKSEMKRDADLADKLKLISLSFDPEIDTPEVMALYGNNFRYAGSAGEWQFVTTESSRTLDPILDAYDQDVQRQVTQESGYNVEYSHLLRVFLIDPEKRIRNIYSVAFLHHELIINDFKTLLIQAKSNEEPQQSDGMLMANSSGTRLATPGDDKRGYESADYQTNSRALSARRGVPTNLLGLIDNPPLGLPAVPVPSDNRPTAEKVELGRKLFFDRRLSLNDTFSCAMCHVPEQGFTSNEIAMAVGIEGRSVRRNSPTIYNSAYADLLFHDGREDSLEQQVWGPLLANNEMANPSIGYVVNKIRNMSDYSGMFEAAFDGKGAGMETIGMALASYQRTLVSANSPFDRWYFADEEDSMTESPRLGFQVFIGKGGCVACHSIGKESALFTDNQMHNTGVGYRESMGIYPEKEEVVIAPGVVMEIDRSVIDSVGESPPSDVGLYEVTQNPNDRWKYKTPSLRNVALTAPYMHNGSLSTLKQVVEFYDAGGVSNELQDPLIKPLGLTGKEKQGLIDFMRSLTGSNVDTLVADAFAAPVGDIKKGDPVWVHGTTVEVK